MHLPKAMIKYWLDFTSWKRQNQPWFAQAKRQFIRDAHRDEGSAEGPGQERPQAVGLYLEIHRDNSLKGNQCGQRLGSKSQCPFRWLLAM